MDDEANRQCRIAWEAIVHHGGTTGCCEWRESVARAVRNNPDLNNITPTEFKRLAIAYLKAGGRFDPRPETDETKMNRRFGDWVYQICFPVNGLSRPFFMKFILLDDDEDAPEVEIVSAHLSSPG